jgi:hypothetical protein
MALENWNLSKIDMESDAFMAGCGDAQFRLGCNAYRYTDLDAFADYCCGYDLTCEQIMREMLGEDAPID